MSHSARASAPKRKRRFPGKVESSKRHGFNLWLLIVPLLIFVVLFSYLPLFGWVYAFFDYQPPIPLSKSKFVGLQWFEMMIQNPAQLRAVWQVLINTFGISGLGILTSMFPLFFAIALNEIRSRWFKNVVQTLTTLPNFISWVLVYAVAFAMFSSSGMVNETLMDLHLITDPIKFLDSDSHTWLKMMAWGLWKGLGWGSIMYLAGIAGIDPELYEAAEVDGANRFQQIIHVTIPQLMPTYFVLLLLSVSNFLNNGMDQYFVFQNAFNLKHIQVLDLYVYNVGMGQNSLSLATAISMLKSLVSVVLLLSVNALSKRVRGESII
ncbi:sugar ABC transporter permease [Bifidobacterium sp. M0399]|uniref:Sugar ABC transporter permease n=1 Tax=Bifidobacterium polysaccharolyticum TaxID=2750967 RepID=A0ABS0QUJ5_9BIFI|nr:sugar ABC transporter permease [Bifidobacterium sp. M0404]MBI0105462.1 sugar ABC transporter permease [Bifidobacterium polysaccharolyticum]MBI0146309.1 sugar ABC transporter permease [Bifidobacterium polysaccharolyticum]MBI0152932.1 sugar ABC transporter permease [Bifidobacterium sp. M0399]